MAAYPTQDGTGMAQAQATMHVTIVAKQTATASVTMASTIDHLEISPANPTLSIGQTLPLILTAKDANNNIVLISPKNIQWSSSDSSIASIDNAGNAQGVRNGSTQITATETESSKILIVTLKVGPAISP